MSSNNIYKSPICSCIHCHEVKSAKGIHSHYIGAHTVAGNNQKLLNFNSEKAATKRIEYNNQKIEHNLKLYHNNPSKCLCCDKILDYKYRKNTFCYMSCSGRFNNKRRKEDGYVHSDKTKLKISSSLKENVAPFSKVYRCKKCGKYHQSNSAKQICFVSHNNKIKISKPKHPYTPVIHCVCAVCNIQFFAKSYNKYCSKCKTNLPNARFVYRFKFNVYDYPDIFDLALLSEVGFYAPGGKSGKWNINGLSRDHKVSVSEAMKNDYDPFYIAHPLNCELMPHKENDKKKDKSSISYNELKQLVDEYEQKLVQSCGADPLPEGTVLQTVC